MTPAGTRRVEAACTQGAAVVMAAARALPYVEDVTIFGNALHLLVTAGGTAPSDDDIARDLAASSGAAVAVRPIEPSLEDVFVRLTQLQGQAPAGTTSAPRPGVVAPR